MDPISLIPQLDPSVKAALGVPAKPVAPAKPALPAPAEVALPTDEQLAAVAAMIESSLAAQNVRLHFSMSESNRVIVQVIDEHKGEVIRTVPPESFFKSALSGGGLGLLVDQSG